MTTQIVYDDDEQPKPKKPKKSSGNFVLFLLLIAVLCIGGCIYYAEDEPRPEFHTPNM